MRSTVEERRVKMAAETTTATPNDVKRFSVNFSQSIYQVLEELAKIRGKSLSETLRDAIALFKWFEDTRQQGAKILVEYPDGKIREIVPIGAQ
jgi:hypothetical protein